MHAEGWSSVPDRESIWARELTPEIRTRLSVCARRVQVRFVGRACDIQLFLKLCFRPPVTHLRKKSWTRNARPKCPVATGAEYVSSVHVYTLSNLDEND